MFHLLTCLTTFNIGEYITKRELNNWCGVSSICNSLHIELHLTCSIVCCTLPCHASLNRTCIILGCASCHVYVMFVYYVVCFFLVLLLRVGSDNVVLWGFVRLRPFVFFMDSFFFLAGSQARWPYPRNHFYLCLLVVRSIAMPRYLPLAISCLPYCHVKPLTHLVLANRCLAMWPLCSAPLIALLVAGEDWSLFLVGAWIFCWDITIYLI